MDGNYREAFQKSDELFEVGNYKTPLYQQLRLMFMLSSCQP